MLEEAVEKRIPINELDFYYILNALAWVEHEKLNVIKYWEDEPNKDDYDNENDYLADLAKYQESKEEYMEKWNLEEFSIEDPSDRLRVLDKYEGKQVANEQDSDSKTFTQELDQGIYNENTCF